MKLFNRFYHSLLAASKNSKVAVMFSCNEPVVNCYMHRLDSVDLVWNRLVCMASKKTGRERLKTIQLLMKAYPTTI